MKVIVGLGNIGEKYANTHHNTGFVMIDAFAEKMGLTFSKKKFDAFVAEGNIDGENVVLMKPTTFMNLSGKSVSAIARKLKIDSKNIIIIYDDIDLPVGKVRYRENGSGGTHNGMKNIIELMGTQDIPRIRVGIGSSEQIPLVDYVLGKFSKEDMEKINEAKPEVFEKLNEFISHR